MPLAQRGATVSLMYDRQWFLDECLRIAVWELIFGTGTRASVDALLADGARWHDPQPPFADYDAAA